MGDIETALSMEEARRNRGVPGHGGDVGVSRDGGTEAPAAMRGRSMGVPGVSPRMGELQRNWGHRDNGGVIGERGGLRAWGTSGARGYRGLRGLWVCGVAVTGMSVLPGLVGVGAQHGSNRVVTEAQGLGALSPGAGDSEDGGTRGVTRHRRVAGSGGLHTLRYKDITGHEGSAHGVNEVPPGLERLGTWIYRAVTRVGGP